ncbi:MAG: DNA polymerase III subunit delta [Flaviflexus sp.]|nr:DNA polymerase III subunit delta [Flaviflexus sp.]
MAKRMSWDTVELAPVVLIQHGEELLADWACERLIAAAKKADPEVSLVRIDAASYEGGQLAQLAAPSLFGGSTIAIAKGASKANARFLRDAGEIAAHPSPDLTLVIVESGGVRSSRMAKTIGKEHPVCAIADVKRDGDKAAILQNLAKRAKRKVRPDAIGALLESLGGDLRELVSGLTQLLADTEGELTAAQVRTYYRGRIEATGYAVADAVVAGQVGKALSLMRHAVATGTDEVVIVAALAMKFRQLALVAGAGGKRGNPPMQPWQAKRARRDLNMWRDDSLARAIETIARTDALVKGFGGEVRDPSYALESCILSVCAAQRA